MTSASNIRTVVVCLPYDVDLDWFTVTERLYHRTGHTGVEPAAIWPMIRRHSRARLLALQAGRPRLAAGGPIQALGLRAASTAAAHAAADRCRIFTRVVAGTPPARPWHLFVARHAERPGRYTRARAEAEFLAQPRVGAILAHNADPAATVHLDPSEIEYYQAGLAGYARLHQLAALTGDGVVTVDGRWLHPASRRLADRLAFQRRAYRHLAGLHPAFQLAAARIT